MSLNLENNTPLWLLAELTHRCPLQCLYCSNPLQLTPGKDELTTKEWFEVLRAARDLGAVQLGFSGGEPLLRRDLEELVSFARGLGYYSNLITSGIGLTAKRLKELRNLGLDHVQLSMQGLNEATASYVSGGGHVAAKQAAVALIKACGFPMVLNVVIHRHNISEIPEILAWAQAAGADYIELASVQFDGWAHKNRALLLPDREQVAKAQAEVEKFRAKYTAPKVFLVVADYFEDRPKPCCNGWGKNLLVIAPDGVALPCHGARKLLGDSQPNVKSEPLATIWRDSELFKRFRGTAWMKEPCRTCPERQKDYGGCRCQAFLLTGDAANADPVCRKSPHRAVVDNFFAVKGGGKEEYRKISLSLSSDAGISVLRD